MTTWEGSVTRVPHHPGRYVLWTRGRFIPLHAGDPVAVQMADGRWVPGRLEYRDAQGWVWIGPAGTHPLADGLRVRLGG